MAWFCRVPISRIAARLLGVVGDRPGEKRPQKNQETYGLAAARISRRRGLHMLVVRRGKCDKPLVHIHEDSKSLWGRMMRDMI